MERVSTALGRIMLSILFAVAAAAMLAAVRVGLTSRSYLIAMALGAAGAAALLWLWRHVRGLSACLRRPGAGKLALWLTVLCAAVHLAWVLVIRIDPFSDYETYWQCACALAFGRPIASTEYLAVYPHILGYSTFLSLFVKLFGEHVLVGAVLNVALTCLSGLLIYALCLRLLSQDAAALAYLLWIFMPTKLMLNSLIFSEPLYTCLILLFLFSVEELERRQDALRPRLWLCVLPGAALGLLLRALNIVRPLAAILIIAYLLWLLLLRGRALLDGRLWAVWLLVSAAMLGAYSASGPVWDRHVERVLGEEPASLPIYNIYVGFNEETQGQWSAEDMDLLFAYKRGEGLSAGEAQRRMLPHLRERLSSGIDFFRLFRSKLFAFLGNDELGGYTYRFTRPEAFVKIGMVIGNVYYYAVAALMFAGLCALLRRGAAQSAALLCPLFALGLTLAHMLVEVSSRYHYSIMPAFILIAAFAADVSNKKSKGGSHDTETVHHHPLL